MNKLRRKHSAAFKAEVALAAIKEREALSELSGRYGIPPTVISTWKNEFLKRSEELFSKHGPKSEADFEKERQELYFIRFQRKTVPLFGKGPGGL